MSRVKELKRMIDTAPKSLSVYSATSTPPAPIAGASWGRTTVRNTSRWPRPMTRAASSSDGSIRRRALRSGISTSG